VAPNLRAAVPWQAARRTIVTGSHPTLHQLFEDGTGQNLIEYALIAMLIAMVVISAVSLLSNPLIEKYTAVTNSI
jgi:Flp pilus assembly pilin Flp